MALCMIEEAEKRGDLKPGGTIVDQSTGNTGPALSFVGAVKGYEVQIFLPAQLSSAYNSADRIRIARLYGADVTPIDLKEHMENADQLQGVTLGSNPHVFVPITMRDVMIPGWEGFDKRRAYWAYLFARLRPEISIDKARQSVNVPYRAIINDVEAALQEGMSDPTLERFRARQVTLEPGARGQSSMHGEARGPLVLLLGVTAVVLLIACANIANLLLIRAASRGTELAVRLSIGASRRHVVLQLLTESCLLGILGGLGGLLMARWTLGLVVSILPPDALDVVQTSLDWRALAFAAALSIGTGLLFGLFPAISSTRPDLVSALRAQSGLTSGARSAGRFRATLATGKWRSRWRFSLRRGFS